MFRAAITSSSSPVVSSSSARLFGVAAGDGSRSTTTKPETTNRTRYRVFLGVGSNLGNRFQNIHNGLKMLSGETKTRTTTKTRSRNEDDENGDVSGAVQLIRTSFLYQTAPMYLHDQPCFLNGAVLVETNLEPHDLLRKIKKVEQELGRNFSQVRNGPRPLDLDILLYDKDYDNNHDLLSLPDNNSRSGSHNSHTSILVDTPQLSVPHKLLQEREFVLRPLCEVAGSEYVHPRLNQTLLQLLRQLVSPPPSLNQEGYSGHDNAPTASAVRILPLPRNRQLVFNQTAIIMGILNVTPDSFSDGGQWLSKNKNDNNHKNDNDRAVQHALEMERQGASIIDIGGESTRPGAKEITWEEQVRRTIPVIESIRKASDICISIDTRNALVARAAVLAGADLVNDVSGGCHDPDMLSTVAELGVPIILMHMRGTPQTMTQLTHYERDVAEEVAQALYERMQAAEAAGIPRWLQVVDPGIGFAKNLQGNLRLLKHLGHIRNMVDHVPILLGTSRKGFIGKLTGVDVPEERDYGTVASLVASLCLETSTTARDNPGVPTTAPPCTILRVHNVAATRQAMLIMEAIQNA